MNVFLRILSGVTAFIGFVAQPIFWYKSRGKRKFLPPIKSDILMLCAVELADKIRKQVITSEQACIAYIERIKEVNPILNAVVEDRFVAALEEAKEIDKQLKSPECNIKELEKYKPLLGVPLTVKESCSLKGSSITGGTVNRKGFKADNDGEAVANLKASGAIPLLVSNTPELCLSWEAYNFVTGRTNNAYDTTRTSSGSSGGEGALLGAGASLLGVGSDLAGSIRLPAMFNGVFGHKPSPKLISIKGHYPYCEDKCFADFLVIGPMTRYAKDLTLMTRVMAGENAKGAKLDEKVDLSNLKVFYMEDAGFSLVFPKVRSEIKTAVKKSVKYLKDSLNAEIREEKFTELENSCEIGGSVLHAIKDTPYLLKGENEHLPVELLKALFGQSKYTLNLLFFYTLEGIYKSIVTDPKYFIQNENLRRKFIDLLGDTGVFIYPTFPTPAFRHNEIFFKISGVMYLMMFNVLGLPATHVPCGFDKNGLPIGIQVVGAPNQDRLCLAVAEELEKCFGGWIPPESA